MKRFILFSSTLLCLIATTLTAQAAEICSHQRTSFSCSAGQKCYTEALSAFAKDLKLMSPCVKMKPFIYSHGYVTEKSILMVHGFTGSPYHMKDLAEHFYKELGYNVVSVVLTGHGSREEQLAKFAKSQDWYNDVDWGFKVAQQLGHKTYILGHSLGGGLVLRKALRSSQEVAGLYLFDPLISINPKFDVEVFGSCATKSLYATAEEFLVDKAALSYSRVAQGLSPLPGASVENFELYPKVEKELARFSNGVTFTFPNPKYFSLLLPASYVFPWQGKEYVRFPGTYAFGPMAAGCELNPMLNEVGRSFGYKKLNVPTFILYSYKENNIVNAAMNEDLVKTLKAKETSPGDLVIDLAFKKEEKVSHGVVLSLDPYWEPKGTNKISRTLRKIAEFDQRH